MKITTAWAAAGAVLLSGCVIREVHHIHHVRDADKGSPAASNSCDRCGASDAPGAVMAESQPPAPLDEEPFDQPGADSVWTSGYWDWNGTEWVWVPGYWGEPPAGVVFVPPAYYAYGSGCLYVPGRWEKNGRPVKPPPRDHRTHRTVDVRDHRGEGKKAPPPKDVRDHRGERTTSPVDRARGRDMVITLPPRRGRPSPDQLAPSGTSSVAADRVDHRDVDRAAVSPGRAVRDDVVIREPRPEPSEAASPAAIAPSNRSVAQPDGPVILVAPPPRQPTRGAWARPDSRPVRQAPAAIAPPASGAWPDRPPPSAAGRPDRFAPARSSAPAVGRPDRFAPARPSAPPPVAPARAATPSRPAPSPAPAAPAAKPAGPARPAAPARPTAPVRGHAR